MRMWHWVLHTIPALLSKAHWSTDIRARDAEWRKAGYPGVSSVTSRLLEYWTDPEEFRCANPSPGQRPGGLPAAQTPLQRPRGRHFEHGLGLEGPHQRGPISCRSARPAGLPTEQLFDSCHFEHSRQPFVSLSRRTARLLQNSSVFGAEGWSARKFGPPEQPLLAGT